jgi:hypothetical protein
MSEQNTRVQVPMEVRWTPAWLSWVAATTTCLRALGVECDPVEVAGMTGYAFHLGIARGLCPSGPTAFDWGPLLPGVARLGRSTLTYQAESYTGPRESAAVQAQYREVFELARREVAAGRPCVLWGAYIPEFAAVVGITGDAYVVQSFKACMGEDQPAIPFAELNAPGGPYLLAFPTPAEAPPQEAERRAIAGAVARFRSPSPGPMYRYGASAYDLWIAELQARRADAGGNSYNAACYAEGRGFARDFLQRLAARSKTLTEPLRLAAVDYAAAAAAMARVAGLFPFSAQYGTLVEDAAAIAAAVPALREARDAESRAIERLAEVAGREA